MHKYERIEDILLVSATTKTTTKTLAVINKKKSPYMKLRERIVSVGLWIHLITVLIRWVIPPSNQPVYRRLPLSECVIFALKCTTNLNPETLDWIHTYVSVFQLLCFFLVIPTLNWNMKKPKETARAKFTH